MHNGDLFDYLEPIHIIDWKAFKNHFWHVLRGSNKIGYISHDVDGSYSYNDLTVKLLKRERIRLNATCYNEAACEVRGFLK